MSELETHSNKRQWIIRLHQLLFSFNIAAALGLGFFLYCLREVANERPPNDLEYYFRLAAVRIADVLHLGIHTAVSTSEVARNFQVEWLELGYGQTIIVSILCLTFVVWFAVTLTSGGRFHRVVLRQISCIAALFAVPIAFLVVSKITWGWSWGQIFSERPYSFWASVPPAVLGAEVVCLALLFFVLRRFWPMSSTVQIILSILHYGFWIPVIWAGVSRGFDFDNSLQEVFSQFLPASLFVLVLAFPLSGIAWFVYQRQPNSTFAITSDGRRTKMALGTLSFLSLLCIGFLWLPRPKHSLTTGEISSLQIQFSRGPCFGNCPSYTVNVRGDESLEFIGHEFVGTRGRQTSTVGVLQVAQMLASLNDMGFSELDDRAFRWCFDTPTVEVKLTMDGRTKTVASDAGCVGSASGRQAKFVRTVAEFDKLVDTERWAKCDGRCRN